MYLANDGLAWLKLKLRPHFRSSCQVLPGFRLLPFVPSRIRSGLQCCEAAQPILPSMDSNHITGQLKGKDLGTKMIL